MNKREFKKIVNEGIDRNKNFMVVKIKGLDNLHPTIVIVQNEDILRKVKSYSKLTNDNMMFEDTGDQIIDVLMTNNLNDLSWFAY